MEIPVRVLSNDHLRLIKTPSGELAATIGSTTCYLAPSAVERMVAICEEYLANQELNPAY